ncbi:MAG: ParA family protein [SAR324 cluster bacterium]|nr:ParA family protein [SAR324 cluster bacterium]
MSENISSSENRLSWMQKTGVSPANLKNHGNSQRHSTIISLVQTKGGTGKSTLARCLAYSRTFQEQFQSIALVELDPQGTLKDWYDQRPQELRQQNRVCVFQLLTLDQAEMEREIHALKQEYGLLILDLPGESTAKFATQFAMAVSDKIVVPMRYSAPDFQSFAKHLQPLILRQSCNSSGDATRFLIIPTFVHPNTNPQLLHAEFEKILPHTVECLKYYLPLRSVYENYSWASRTLHEYARTVKTNSREHDQAAKAIHDVEMIASTLLSSHRQNHMNPEIS